MINSIELLSEKKIPGGAELCLPTDVIFYVVNGTLTIGGGTLGEGQYLALEKNRTVTFDVDRDRELCLLVLSFDCFDGMTVGEVCSASCQSDLNRLLGEKDLWIPNNSRTAEKMTEYVLSLLVECEETISCGNRYVDMAKRYIDSNYFLDIKIEELAEKIGVDRKYLRNLFVEYLGVSTKDYIMNLRIERAKKLLTNKDVPVNSVAFSVGYADALGFSKIFKKYTGLSPSDFRNGNLPQNTQATEKASSHSKKEDIKYFLL